VNALLRHLAGALLGLLLLPGAVAAQPNFSRITLLSAVNGLGGGEAVLLGIQIEPQTGWKTYWRSAGESGLPPLFTFTVQDNADRPQILWPAPKRLTLQGQESYGYDGVVIFPLRVQPIDAATPLTLVIQADYAVCKDICVPEQAILKLTIPPGASRGTVDAASLQAALAKVPQPQHAQSPLRIIMAQFEPDGQGGMLRVTVEADFPFAAPDLFADGHPDLLFSSPAIRYGGDRRSATFDLTVTRLDPSQLVAGQSLTLTLVDGGEAVEKQVSVAQTSGTR